MKLESFAVFDNKAAAFITPFFLPTVAMAQRAFGACANDAKHQFGQFPTDFTLFRIGWFDDSTGEFHAVVPENLGLAASFVTFVKETEHGSGS